MQNNRCLFFVVFINIGQVEFHGQAEIQLTGGKRILSSYGRTDVDIQLRAVESGFPDLFRVLQPQFIQNGTECILRIVPHFIIIVILFFISRITQRQDHAVVRNAEILIGLEDQRNNTGNLVLDLIRCHEQMRVVLAEMPCPLDAFEGSGCFIAEVMCYFADSDRQIPV